MKILHVLHTADPASGGPFEFVLQSTTALFRAGHTVDVVSLDPPSAASFKVGEAPIYPVGDEKASSYGFSERFVPWMRENASRFDAVIVNGLWQYTGLGAWRALRKAATPYFVFPHGMLDPWFKKTYPIKHLKKCLYWTWAENRILRDARSVIFTCEEERLLAQDTFPLYKCHEAVVNLGTTGNTGDRAIQTQLFLDKFPELRSKRILLFLGRIHEKKGCDLLIEAFAKVCAVDPALVLVMTGPDQTGLRANLESLAQARGVDRKMTWTGMLQGDEKWGAFHLADAFILPSHQENFGIAVVEALSCGVPVLISNKVNIWREIKNDGAGLVAPDDLSGTHKLLNDWLQMPTDQKDRMRRSARLCFEQRFESQKSMQALVDVFRRAGVNDN